MIKETAQKLKKSFSIDTTSNGFNTNAEIKLKKASKADKDIYLSMLNSKITGLSISEVNNKQKEFGLNEIAHEKAPAWYIQFLQAFLNPFIGVLIVIAIISLITDVLIIAPKDRDYKTLTVLSIMVFLSSFLRFWQEFRSNKAAEQLKGMVKTTALILREAVGKKEIDIKEIVPGDLIFLSAGDMIPADCRIIQTNLLIV